MERMLQNSSSNPNLPSMLRAAAQHPQIETRPSLPEAAARQGFQTAKSHKHLLFTDDFSDEMNEEGEQAQINVIHDNSLGIKGTIRSSALKGNYQHSQTAKVVAINARKNTRVVSGMPTKPAAVQPHSRQDSPKIKGKMRANLSLRDSADFQVQDNTSNISGHNQKNRRSNAGLPPRSNKPALYVTNEVSSSENHRSGEDSQSENVSDSYKQFPRTALPQRQPQRTDFMSKFSQMDISRSDLDNRSPGS